MVQARVSQKCQGHHWMQNCVFYSTMGSEWGQLDNKKKKRKKRISFVYHSSSHLKIPRTLPVFWLNKASHRKSKGTIGCRIECFIQPWGQNEASLTTKDKKKSKNRFFQHLSVPPGYSVHEHCLFCGWTKRLTEMPRAPLDAELNALFNHGVRMRPAWQQKTKKNQKIDFFSIYQYHPVTVSTNIACFLVEPGVSQKWQGHHWMQNWMLYSTLRSEWGQLGNNKKKKMKKKIFSAFISTTRLQFPRTLPVFWLNQASHRNAKGIIGCRIECSVQPWGQNEASLTTKKKKNEKKDFFSIYHYHPVTVSTDIACFLAEPSVSEKCQGHHWMQNWMLYSTMGSEWGQLENKKKKKWKKRFFRYITAVVTWKLHEHCVFCGWTKRLTEMPRAPLDVESNALFNHGVRMRPAAQQKRKKMKKKFFRYITAVVTWKLHEHCVFSGWTKRLTEMPRAPLDAELNALFNHGVRMRPAGQQKTKKNQKIDFFSIYQYHPVTVSTNIACFMVEPSVSQKCQRHHWMQNWMLYSTMGSEWGQLDSKKK